MLQKSFLFCCLELYVDESKRRDVQRGRPAEDAEDEQGCKEQQRACGGEVLEPAGSFAEETGRKGGEEAAKETTDVT